MLTTLAILKESLDVSGTSKDAWLTRIIGAVSAAFAGHCGRVDPRTGASLFERQVGFIEYPHGNSDRLVLRLYPIESVSEIVQASDRDYANATPLVENVDWVLDDGRPDAIVHLLGAFLSGRQMVRATYTGGYYTGDAGSAPSGSILLPDDLRNAATLQAIHEYKHRDKFGERSIQIGDMSVSQVKDGLLTIVRQQLEPYVRYA